MKSQQNRIVIVSGGFDPIHSGHIAYLNAAKALGGKLIVGLNSDDWLVRKKRKAFMSFEERYAVISHLNMVDDVYSFYDGDNTAKDLILQVRARNPDDIIVFANGGDRSEDKVPESSLADENTFFLSGVGGDDKKNSSSKILEKWAWK